MVNSASHVGNCRFPQEISHAGRGSLANPLLCVCECTVRQLHSQPCFWLLSFTSFARKWRWGWVQLSTPFSLKANTCEVAFLFMLPNILLGLICLINIQTGSRLWPVESSHHGRLDFCLPNPSGHMRNGVGRVWRASALPLRVGRHVLRWSRRPIQLRKKDSKFVCCPVSFS